METVLVQINNIKAYKLLEDLEELQILKVLKKSIGGKKMAADKLRSATPAEEDYDDFQQHLKFSEKSLAKDWLTPKEDEVWRDL